MPRIAISICATLMRSALRSVGFLLTSCNRPAVMKNRIVSIGFVSCLFFCHATVMRAQVPATALTPEAPVLPMDVKFRHVPQYFEQSFTDDPRYARIEALVDEERCDIILLDKTTNREALYSNLNRRGDKLLAASVKGHVYLDSRGNAYDVDGFREEVDEAIDRVAKLNKPAQRQK
jgi:hypothetical protein